MILFFGPKSRGNEKKSTLTKLRETLEKGLAAVALHRAALHIYILHINPSLLHWGAGASASQSALRVPRSWKALLYFLPAAAATLKSPGAALSNGLSSRKQVLHVQRHVMSAIIVSLNAFQSSGIA
jgi:hypothetical protein